MPHKSGNSGRNGRFRDLYAAFFYSRGILPDALARQKPRLLFGMLDSVNAMAEDEKSEIPKADELNDYERMFYGY